VALPASEFAPVECQIGTQDDEDAASLRFQYVGLIASSSFCCDSCNGSLICAPLRANEYRNA
jgi:hypothetical protein